MARRAEGHYGSSISRVLAAAILWLALGGLFAGQRADAAENKRLLVLQSFGRDFRPWGEYAKSIRTELDRLSPWQIDVQDHALVVARFSDENPEWPFIQYLHSINAQHPPDVIIAVGAPAAGFIQRNRARLFPATPVVFTAVEQRRIRKDALTDNDTVVAVAHDFPRSFETILQVLPNTKRIVVINGASPNETFWLGELRKDAKRFQDRVEFVWNEGLSFEDIVQQCAHLPPDSAIFWHLMNVDATGVSYEGVNGLQRLHSVANAPIFSYDDGFFGRDIVGGPMYSVSDISRLTATVVMRILNGEKPGDINIPAVSFAAPKFDWRELRRWGISESSLPAGSEVMFREPTFWERYRWQVALVTSILLLQAALISGLFHERRARRLAEVESRQRLTEIARLNRYSAAGELAASIAHELNQPLGSILTNAETAALLLNAPSPDIAELREILSDIKRDDQRASEVIRRLRRMLKKVPFEVRKLELNETVKEAVNLVSALAVGRGVALRSVSSGSEVYVKGDPIQLQQVVLNLVINAVDALSDSERQKREVVVITGRSGSEAEVRVMDTGPGITPDRLKEIFDPFFTTKTNGLGMGLAIVRTIVEGHHGSIEVENRKSGGAEFRVRLPLWIAPANVT